MKRRIWLVPCLAFAVAACARRAFDPFPPGAEAAGWEKGRTRVFEASELWQYVDGDAERYLAAGHERTLTAEYRHSSGTEAVLDVHLMKDAEAARQIFESEPAAGSQAIALGDAGRSYGTSVSFRRGRCFVRLTSYSDTPQARSALLELARAADGRIARARP
ncbi:MAG: DUF6599 family protein [Bryobacterales bacterium]|nr:hypothetical protein [Bryobacteraceae bacterium]MDW8129641.1 DUF6599 family protein [Bryobacterales bacterium]